MKTLVIAGIDDSGTIYCELDDTNWCTRIDDTSYLEYY